jgi:CBS domain-containing protein
MDIQEIMSQPAVTCGPHDTLEAAARLMWEHDCGALPVVDQGRLVGMITDRDICMSAFTRARPLYALAVTDAMAKQVFSCRAEDSLDDAEQLMSEKQIRRIPIVDGDNRPMGLLSLSDIARHAAGSRRKDGSERHALRTLAAISQPRAQALQAHSHAAHVA